MRFGSILLCAGLLLGQTQPGSHDQCRLEGKVLNSATAQPLLRASVTLQATSSTSTIVTDGAGNFAFTGLAPGRYSIIARRDNFQSDSWNSLTLAPGEEKKDVVLRLVPYGAIAGHVRDEAGDPVSDLRVSAMVYMYGPNGRQLVTRSTATTNDLGEYRLFGLLAGKYILKTAQRPAPSVDQIYPAVYYPNVTDPSGAAPLVLSAGQQLPGNDFTVRPATAVRVRGRVLRPAGSTQAGVSLMSGGGGPAVNGNVNEPQGTFELYSVAPGAYILGATVKVGEKFYVARRPIQVVAEEVGGIELRPAPPVDLNGVVRIEGSAGIKLSQLRIGTEWASRIAVKEDGSFAFHDLMPDLHHPAVERPDSLFVKSMRCGNADVIDSGVDLTGGGGCDLVVTLSANGGQIEGDVVDQDGQPAKAATVTLSAQGTKRSDLSKSATADASGHFKIVGVAPGTYRLYAWDHVDLNSVWYDPDYVKPFEIFGRSLQITESVRESLTLKRIANAAGQ